MNTTNRGGLRKWAVLLVCASLFLLLAAVIKSRWTVFISDACAYDGRYQIAVEGAYILVDPQTCQYGWNPDECEVVTDWHKLCAPVLQVKHYNIAWGDPAEFCAGGPTRVDTSSGFTYHKHTLTQ